MRKYTSAEMDSYYLPIAVYDAERAVIEAAKAAKESLIYYVGDTGSVDVGDLLDAVEALEKESDG